ncbi:COG3904 family protein [Gymnodinialimonas sp.]
MIETEEAPRGFTVKRAITAILAFQIAMAVVLAGSDLISALPRLLAGTSAPNLDAPVAPGDQVRRYRPGDLPARDRTDPARQTPIPDPGDMPTRLRFSVEGDVALLTGQIAPGDSARFAEWLEADATFEAIRLHSPGGSVQDALAIGQAIRDADLATMMEPGDICLSACPYVLAGGTTREIPEGAMVGVHQHYFGENTALPAFLAIEDIQFGQGEVMAHLDAMGVDVRVMQHALTTPPDAIYVLLPEELVEYRMVSAPDDA